MGTSARGASSAVGNRHERVDEALLFGEKDFEETPATGLFFFNILFIHS